MPQKETTKVRDPIVRFLSKNGWRVWRNVVGPYSEQGICDLMALKDGVFIAIETKMPGKKATPMQERFLSEMVRSGAVLACVATSLDDLKKYLTMAKLL